MIENSPLSKSTVIIGTGKIIKAAVAGKIKIAAIFSAWLTTLCNSDELSNGIFSITTTLYRNFNRISFIFHY